MAISKEKLIHTCQILLEAYKTGKLGQTTMPEDSHPDFGQERKHVQRELRLSYFTLPMALNYQRDSYKLWKAALKTYTDPSTRWVFDVEKVVTADESVLREALMTYKLALQPNKHIHTWKTISETVLTNWKTFENLIAAADADFLKLRERITVRHKKGFPYLSGPKIFNYWSFILSTYGGVTLKNRNCIGIAPDTHITQCSVKLAVITEGEAETLSKEEITARWAELLEGSGIDPIDMHPPLWFWSRNKFIFRAS